MRNLLKQFKSDESLMLDYQQGDSSAFDMLYMRHKDKLFNFIYRSCQHPESVEDIAHETWMAVIRAAEKYKNSAKFTTWLFQIARNKIIDQWRKQKPESSDIDLDQLRLHDALHVGNKNAGEQLHLIQELFRALQCLPFEQREAFLLKEEGFSQSEIAEITDAKPETVKSRVRYAKKQLRSLMETAA